MKKTIAQLLFLLIIATALGWYYGSPVGGALVGALLAIAWNLQKLYRLDRFMTHWDLNSLPEGDDAWSQIFSKAHYLRQRNLWHKRRYRSLLKEIRKSTDAMPDSAVLLNEYGEIQFCNAAAEKLIGIKSRQDRGQRINNFIRSPRFVQYLKSANQSQPIEIASPVIDDVLLSCQLLPYGGGQRLLLARDITDRQRLTKMRRDFVANASHELRTPLTVITGYLEGLVDDPSVPEAWGQPLLQMQMQSVRMNTIVNGLLELSQLETRGIAAATHEIDVCGLINSATESLQDESRLSPIKVDCASDVRLLGDSNEIDSVIVNLLSNALRHTPKDKDIRISWRRNDDGAVLQVADSGEGVPKQYLPRLTERFFRVDQGRGSTSGGVGLGLAIVKYIVGRHEGKLSIESELGMGTSVSCFFPTKRLATETVYQD